MHKDLGIAAFGGIQWENLASCYQYSPSSSTFVVISKEL